jgi:uncharacterized protein (TIGR00159 family)
MNELMIFLYSIRWQDVIDIALASYLLFRFYVLFTGTYVFRVITGLAILWVFQQIIVFMGLIVSSWAIQGIMAVSAIIVIVVFKNEIRSVLQAKNLKSILWGFPAKAEDTPIEMIVESVYELAQAHTGALIVFPGKEDLGEVVQSGIPWGGVVSKEMIKSIFWHDNPVHDGAAIIEGARVKEVGGILPLSRRDDLPSYCGTRHRAAAGLAENTDALVIAVSEERGDVTIAKGSRVRVIKEKKKFIDILQKHVGVSKKQWSHLRKRKLELSTAGLISIVFIASVWFNFTSGMETLITFEIPVEYTNRNPEMKIYDTSVNAVSLSLYGSGTLMRSIRPEQIEVRLDIGKAIVGPNTFAITQGDITLPPGVSLKNVEPSTVEVTLDIPLKKLLPVQVDWIGRLSEHLILKAVKLDPETVEVVGGRGVLENISTIYTEKVSLNEIEESGTVVVKLVFNPAFLEISPDLDDGIKITYEVEKRSNE